MSQTISGTGIPTFSQTYTYDGVNRLWTMSEASPSSLQRTYTYDAYGNRAVSGTQVGVGTPTSTGAFTASNNRMTSTWASYDVAGNQLSANRSGAQWSAAYDGENKQVYFCAATAAACNATNAAAAYVYDGEGNRVQKLTAGVTDTFVYDAFGRLAAEYSTGPGDEPGRYFRTTDHLGSTRLVTNAAMDVVSRRDFFPFGEQILANTTSGHNGIVEYNAPIGFPQLFTGKERDDESGLDYFLARYYSGSLGRFTSVDPENAGALLSDPQSWNGYAYVTNRPLTLTDPDGRCPWCVGAIVGAVTDIAIQVTLDGRSFSEVDLGSVAISAAAGATGAGLATKLTRLGKAARIGVELATDAAASAASQLNEKGEVSLGATVLDVTVGGYAGHKAGSAAGEAASNSRNVKSLRKEADRKTRIANRAESAGNQSSARRRHSQASALTTAADEAVARRTGAASASASQLGSKTAEKVVEKIEDLLDQNDH